MKVRVRLGVMLALTAFVVGGCKTSPSVEVYLSDLIAVADGQSKPVAASARVVAEVMTKAQCEQDQAKLVAMLGRQSEVKDFACAETKGQLYAEARFTTKVPIVLMDDKGQAKLSQLLTIGVDKRRPGDGAVSVYLFLSAPAMKALAADVRQNYLYDMGKGEIGSVTVTVVNDLPTEREVSGVVSYVNGIPKPYVWKQALPRREKLEIGLANVAADGLRTNVGVPVFLVEAAKP